MGDVGSSSGAPPARRNLRFEAAQDLFDGLPELAEDVTARPDGEDAVSFATALAEGPTPEEAITVCAYNLPRRYAVWWGHECLRRAEQVLGEDDTELMKLAADWVANQNEQTRYAALNAAMAQKDVSPGGWIAFGAGWAGGSMSGPDLPPVPPAPHLTAKAVNAGILTVLARIDLENRRRTLGSFVRMAIQLSEDA
ncbi:hypothetical protein RM543_04545 [Roseicyclus sp. F158]|uniref:Secreted protein n=1 Tax=Tropicimonas omnivorans TaxID=3075590 RepID=A0ABU3DE52_9RHOB|nr:hypothetical protein [Roseicyclus sp. F158]MDT0681945.1 hypothetical protein [Roseicyclus sp. F158]